MTDYLSNVSNINQVPTQTNLKNIFETIKNDCSINKSSIEQLKF